MYEMKDEYRTGIEFIDEQHTRLFEIAEQTYQLLQNEFIPDKYDNISSLLEELKDYTKMHFKAEEEYMERIHYKRIYSQQIQHHKFIEKLEEINLDEADENQEQTISDLLEFLTNWLIRHIMDLDKRIGQP